MPFVFFDTFYVLTMLICSWVNNVKVKIFDEAHEKDLEGSVNEFISSEDIDVIDIKYSVSASIYAEEQIYCFSALIMYKESSEE